MADGRQYPYIANQRPILRGDNMNCPLCNYPATVLNTVLRYGEGTVHYCNQCKVGFLEDERTQEELDQYYATEYRTLHGSTDPKAIFDADGGNFQYRRYSKYVDYMLGQSVSPSVLEIGCSAGQFLSMLEKKENIELAGVEPDPNCREYCLSHFPKIELFPSIDLVTRKFDCAVLFQVFEHVKDPKEYIEKIKKLLKPNGRIIIELPSLHDILLNGYNTDIEKYKKVFYHKAHLWYWTPIGIEKFLTNCGFRGKLVYIQDYNFLNHMAWYLNGKTRFPIDNYIVPAMTSFKELNDFFNSTNTSYMDLLEKFGLSSNVAFLGELQ